VHGEQHALLLGPGDLGRQELTQRGDVHHGRVDHLALEDGELTTVTIDEFTRLRRA
jgi:hypothetical protein